MPFMKLTEKIHILQIDFEIALSPDKKLPRSVNVIIIFGERITLIDTGVKGSEKLIFEYIGQNNRDYSEIDRVILNFKIARDLFPGSIAWWIHL